MCRVYREQDCVMHFLKGLNDQFSSVRSQILLMDPLPLINNVFASIRSAAGETIHE